MHKFSDFAADEEHLEGAKKPFQELVGKQIVIWDVRIMPSQFESDSYVMFQFSFEETGERFVSNTGSKVVIEQLRKYKSQLPFETTIVQRTSGKHFYFILT